MIFIRRVFTDSQLFWNAACHASIARDPEERAKRGAERATLRAELKAVTLEVAKAKRGFGVKVE